MISQEPSAIVRSIEACNAGDRAAWLSCYHPAVAWNIIGDRLMSGITELAKVWEDMVIGTSKRTVLVESWISEREVSAVIAHEGNLDTIVCCQLDGEGRIAGSRSYRSGDRDPRVVPRRLLTEGAEVVLAIQVGDRGVAHVRGADGRAEIVEWSAGSL